jgi:hypothetical protein
VLQRVQATLAGQQLAQAYRHAPPPLWSESSKVGPEDPAEISHSPHPAP